MYVLSVHGQCCIVATFFIIRAPPQNSSSISSSMVSSFIIKAAATVSCEDRPNVAAEYMGRAGRLYIRIKKYDDAVSCIKNEGAIHTLFQKRKTILIVKQLLIFVR